MGAGTDMSAPRRGAEPEPLMSSATSELLESKLQPPWRLTGLVARDSLVDRLQGTDAAIVAVVAPPGYGKTTLLAQWVACRGEPCAWLSLDRHDDDARLLLRQLVGALERVRAIDPETVASILAPGVIGTAATLRGVRTLIASIEGPFTLVIDSVELLRSEGCRDLLSELALNLPAWSRLALASRIGLPIPVARLRAQGAICELGPADLAMNDTEAQQLIENEGLRVGDEELRDLAERTEGWPVGIYLGTLALKAGGPSRPTGLAFHGDDRIMADYLRAEILDGTSPATVRFLTRTSVLDQLSGELCDAVLAETGSQERLESIETADLLLVPLDRRRRWYRCHHLFRELLLSELTRREPGMVPLLNDRAAAWFEANGRADLALDHALAAGDADRAARLFAQIGQLTYAAGQVDTAFRWLGWFESRGLVEQHPQIAVLAAIGEAMLGHPAAATRWADAARSGAVEGCLPDGSPFEAWLALMEALMCRRGPAQMRADAERASALLGPQSPMRGAALLFEATARLLDGGDDDAEPVLARAVSLCLEAGALPAAVEGLAERAVIAIARHDWATAESLVRDAMTLVDDGLLDGYPMSVFVDAVAARLEARRGDVARGKQQLARAGRMRPLCTSAFPVSARFLIQLAHAYLELADPAGARATLRQVRDILQLRPDLGTVVKEADELREMLDTIRLETLGASSLTTAELRVLPLLATHLNYADIGLRLNVSRNTIKSHTMSIYRKLGVSSRREAVDRAEQIGLLG
jgi:LuxR family maltose regulon positive regulatory protein